MEEIKMIDRITKDIIVLQDLNYIINKIVLPIKSIKTIQLEFIDKWEVFIWEIYSVKIEASEDNNARIEMRY